MIDELQILLAMLGDITDIALYVIISFGAYKLILYLSTIGAAVMLTKLAIEKLHSWAVAPRRIEASVAPVDEDIVLKCISSDGTDVRVMKLLRLKIAGKRVNNGSTYIHKQSADWLEEAIDEKEKRDEKEKDNKEKEEAALTT